jgi:hypothetical protein
MPYKTLVLALLQQHPTLHQTLRSSGTLLRTLEHSATTLKDRHAYWRHELTQAQPGSDPSQIASQALELAVQDLQDALPADSSPSADTAEPLSLDAAMAFLRRHTPPA